MGAIVTIMICVTVMAIILIPFALACTYDRSIRSIIFGEKPKSLMDRMFEKKPENDEKTEV